MKKGKYIVVEGLDGSGKTTQVELLVNKLRDYGEPVESVVEPTDGPVGKLIRQALSGEIDLDPRVMGMLFIPDTYSHIYGKGNKCEGGLIDKIKNGTTIVSDRSYISTLAYQGQHFPIDWILDAHSLSMALVPDFVIHLDVPVDICMQRLLDRGKKLQIHEKEQFLRAVSHGYLEAYSRLKYLNVCNIQGDRSIESVHNNIWALISGIVF